MYQYEILILVFPGSVRKIALVELTRLKRKLDWLQNVSKLLRGLSLNLSDYF